MGRQIARSFVLAAVMTLPAMAALAVDTLQVELGERTYQAYCALCHGFAGVPGMFAKELKKTAPDLTEIAKRNGGQFPERKIADTIRDGGIGGHGTMRLLAWEKYFRSDSSPERANQLIEALTKYLKTQQIQ
jgi:mono/diheme cytochrome c family protein